jgi:hypothetical protein
VSYEFLLNEPTIQTLGSDIVRDAMRITYRAQPSGVVFSLLFAPVEIWTAQTVADQAQLWSDNWNQNALVPGVVGIATTQQVNAAGNLEDVALVTVSSTSGNSTSQLELPPREWLPSVAGTTLTTSFGDRVRAEVQRLDAIEGTSPPPASGAAAAAEPVV